LESEAPALTAVLSAQNPVPDWTVSYAAKMDNAGDVNGDGYDDVILLRQATYYSDATARIFYGSAEGLSVTANWTIDRVGNMVSGMGDVNGDGYGDVLVGARVFHGSPSGPPPAANWGLTQNGYPAGYTGDVNGDGYGDIASGAPSGDGRVLVLPTASAQEGDAAFEGWARRGLAHYREAGIAAEVVPLRTREDAGRADLLAPTTPLMRTLLEPGR